MMYPALEFQPKASAVCLNQQSQMHVKKSTCTFFGTIDFEKSILCQDGNFFLTKPTHKVVPQIVVPNQKKTEEKGFLRFFKNGKVNFLGNFCTVLYYY